MTEKLGVLLVDVPEQQIELLKRLEDETDE